MPFLTPEKQGKREISLRFFHHAIECIATDINDLIDQLGGKRIQIVTIENTIRHALRRALDDTDTQVE